MMLPSSFHVYVLFMGILLQLSACTLLKDYTECQIDEDCFGWSYCSDSSLCTDIKESKDLSGACSEFIEPFSKDQTILAAFVPLNDTTAIHTKISTLEGIRLSSQQLNRVLEVQREPKVNWLICDSSTQDSLTEALELIKRYGIEVIVGDLYRADMTSFIYSKLTENQWSERLWFTHKTFDIDTQNAPPNLFHANLFDQNQSTSTTRLILNILDTQEVLESTIILVWNKSDPLQNQLAEEFQVLHPQLLQSGEFKNLSRILRVEYDNWSSGVISDLRVFIQSQKEANTPLPPIQSIYFIDESNRNYLSEYQNLILNEVENINLPIHIISPSWSLHPDLITQETNNFSQEINYYRWGVYPPHYDPSIEASEILQELAQNSNREIYYESNINLLYDTTTFASLVTLYSKLTSTPVLSTVQQLSDVTSYNADTRILLSEQGLQNRPITLYSEDPWHVFGISGPILFDFNTKRRTINNNVPAFFCEYQDMNVKHFALLNEKDTDMNWVMNIGDFITCFP